MKRISLYIPLIVLLMIFGACQSIPSINTIKGMIGGEARPTYQEITPDTLPEVSQKAVDAFEMGKRGTLESSPYVCTRRQAIKLGNTTDYWKFMRCNTIIKEFTSDPDGIYVQNMLSESVDQFGRIDVSHERIVYALRKPTESEAAAIGKSMLYASKSTQYMDSASRIRFKQSVKEFQRAHNLSADGVMGMTTAKTAAREASVLDIQEMTSSIVLPETPRTLLYAVPHEVVSQNPAAFNKGFESLDAVKTHALTPEAFQGIDRPGQKFTVFLYFLDRIDPEKDVRIGLASSEYRWSDVITPIAYPPGEWPILIESFQIDETMGGSPLYVNVFQKAKFAYTCIGSHRLK